MPTNSTRSQLNALTSTNFPDNTSQLISPVDLRQWLDDGTASFLTQKDKSTLENAIYECEGSPLAASASVNLASATGNFLHISGAYNGIASFGNCPAGSRFVLVFDGINTLTYNATSLILPGGADITTAANDSCMIISEGSGNWRVVGYFPAAGGGGGGTVTAVTATTPLASTGGTAPDISIQQASASQDGYLDSSDWSTFNGKQDALSAGTGISIASNTVTNTAPDQTVAISAGTGISVTGTYPNFTIGATGGSGGNPGGSDTEIQYNNNGAFGGVSDLTWDDVNNILTVNSPRIGQSIGNGHIHMHTINTSPPSGVADYITIYADKSPKQIGARFENDGYTSAFEFAGTTDNTYTLPNASGNVVLDSATQTLTNKSLTTPSITTPTITGIATIGNGASAGEIRLLEPSGAGTEYVAIKAPATLSSNLDLVLPNASGSNTNVLSTDGSGNLYWASNGGYVVPQFLRNYTLGSVTGTTSNTIAQSVLIPANTFIANTGFRAEVKFSRTVTNSLGASLYCYINTSAAIGGVQVVLVSISSGNLSGIATRSFSIASSTSTLYIASTVGGSDFTQAGAAIGNSNINWAVNQYFVVSFLNQASTQVSNCLAIDIYPI